MKEVADFYAPAWIERIVIQSAPANDLATCLGCDGPRGVAVVATTSFMNGNPAATRLERNIDVSMSHRFWIAEEVEQRGHVRQPRAAQK
jgi:hypothetical protein